MQVKMYALITTFRLAEERSFTTNPRKPQPRRVEPTEFPSELRPRAPRRRIPKETDRGKLSEPRPAHPERAIQNRTVRLYRVTNGVTDAGDPRATSSATSPWPSATRLPSLKTTSSRPTSRYLVKRNGISTLGTIPCRSGTICRGSRLI